MNYITDEKLNQEMIDSLDEQLNQYYAENFTVSDEVPSQAKQKLMYVLSIQKRGVNSVRQFFGYVSAAAFIGIASYMSVDCLVDIKLTHHIQIVE